MTTPSETQNPQVLVVEDEETIAETIQLRLSKLGLNSTVSDNRETAYQALNKLDQFRLVISDLNMPGFNGLVFLKAIKKINPKKEVIILTGWTTNAVDLLDQGAYAIIEKPFTRLDFDPVIRSALEDQNQFCPAEIPQFKAQLKQNMKHCDPIENLGEFQMGRFGFFIHCNTVFSEQEFVRFEISFSNGPLLSLNGVGQVKWIRRNPSNNLLPGLGIQIISLDPVIVASVMEWIIHTNVVASVPKGKR